jgi:hypothetical protein
MHTYTGTLAHTHICAATHLRAYIHSPHLLPQTYACGRAHDGALTGIAAAGAGAGAVADRPTSPPGVRQHVGRNGGAAMGAAAATVGTAPNRKGHPALVRVHLYSTLEIRQTTTLQASSEQLLSGTAQRGNVRRPKFVRA